MKKTLTEVEMKRKMRRKKIRKRRIAILLVFLLIIGIAIFAFLLKTRLFPVKNITARGSKLYTAEQVIKASGINKNTPIFGISERKIRNKVSKKLPYIETLEISRKFPESVTITVSDAREYFAFKTDKGYLATSEKLRILKSYSKKPKSTIKVVANGITGKAGEDVEFQKQAETELFEFLTSYSKEKGIKLTAVDITDSLHITVFVENKFKVNLGTKENLKEKMNHLKGMIPEIGDRKGTINLEMWSKNDSKGTFIAENQS